MANHVWELVVPQPKNDRYRTFKCPRCGKGPIKKDIFSSASFAELAKKAGISPDCNIEIVRDVHDS